MAARIACIFFPCTDTSAATGKWDQKTSPAHLAGKCSDSAFTTTVASPATPRKRKQPFPTKQKKSRSKKHLNPSCALKARQLYT